MLFIAIIITVSFSFIVSNIYFEEIETAIKWKVKSPIKMQVSIGKQEAKAIKELAIIEGEEGIVYFGIGDNNSVVAFNFDIKKTNDTILYRAKEETAIGIRENWMMKMPTKHKGLTEEIAYGIGKSLAQECVSKTGIEAEFLSFEHRGNQYELWYIISNQGLPMLPKLQMNDGKWDTLPSSTNNTAIIIIALVIFVTFISASRKNRIWNKND